MSFLKSLLFDDWRRKVIAIALAITLWFWASGNVATELSQPFVVTTSTSSALSAHSMQIGVPEGWMLVQPKQGASVKLLFDGPRTSLQQFFASPCRASYQAVFNAAQEVDIYEIPFSPIDLSWAREAEAKTYLTEIQETRQPLQVLLFERRKELSIPLSSAFLRIQGEAAEGYAAQPDTAVFSPNQVSLNGPSTEVKRVQRALEQAAQGKGVNYELLEIARISPNQRDTMRLELGLSQRAKEAHLQMQPSTISISLPIRLSELPTVNWIPAATDLSHTGKPIAAHLQFNPWSISPWVATINDSALLGSKFTEKWVRDHIMLFAHRDRIPEDAAEGFTIPIEWALVDIQSADLKKQLMLALTVGPESAGAGEISVHKLEK